MSLLWIEEKDRKIVLPEDFELNIIELPKNKCIEPNQKDVAKKLKDKGIDIDSIIEITGLSKADIENL